LTQSQSSWSLLRTIPYSTAVDAKGGVYVAGRVRNPAYNEAQNIDHFICIDSITKGYSTTYNGGNYDGFLVKFDPTGSLVEYGTFIGGHLADEIHAIAVDEKGFVYVAGTTFSDESSFPIGGDIPGFQTELHGEYNGFAMKLDLTNNAVLYSTYIGGNIGDTIIDLVIDENGCAYIAGVSYSDESSFPIGGDIPGFQTTKNALWDSFVIKLDPTGTQVQYATYIGGDSEDDISAIAIDKAQNVYIAGRTSSSHSSFTNGIKIPGFNSYNKVNNGFILKLDSSGTNLQYAVFLGSLYHIEMEDIALDSSGSVYITGGVTPKSNSDTFSHFPVGPPTPGYQTVYHSSGAFVVKISPNGESLDYATYVATSGADKGVSIDVDSQNSAYVLVQASNSFPPTHPLIPSIERSHKGKSECFLFCLDPSGTLLHHASYIGGSESDMAVSLGLISDHKLILTGTTMSSREECFPIGRDIPGYNSVFYDINGAFVMGIDIQKSAITFSTYLSKKP
jgi:hypothetical protein